MGKSRWNDSLIAVLAETYPVETTTYTAALLGMSETAVKNKAKKLGIVKVAKSRWMERAEHIRSHFQDKSFSEMAKELGISKMSVSRIAAKIGLKRTKEEIYRVSSRVRGEMICRERRRVIFGLSPATRIKVVSNRARVRLRSRLKGIGYIVGKNATSCTIPETSSARNGWNAGVSSWDFASCLSREMNYPFYPLSYNKQPCNTDK